MKTDHKYVFFDLDGTLTDSAEGITNSVAYALKRWNIEVEDKSSLKCFVGPPLAESFERYFGFSKAQALDAVDEYRVYYSDKGIFENTVYPGIPELLGELRARGKRLILATSKPEHYARQILDHFDLLRYFDLVSGATMDSSRTRKELVVAHALSMLGEIDLSACIMVGDRAQDVIGAAHNGIECIGVLYGYGDISELTAANAAYIADKVEDIIKYI